VGAAGAKRNGVPARDEGRNLATLRRAGARTSFVTL
jgi:hypothetical protein